MKTKWALWLVAGVAWGQISTNQSLNGQYFFREVLLVTDGNPFIATTPNVTSMLSGAGTLTFDGNGGFTVSGQQLIGTAAAVSLNGSGTYAVNPGGFVTLSNPLKSGVTLNARLGQGALVGSSTEAGPTVYDLFIAIPSPVGASNGTLSGSYWVSSLEFPGGGLANIRNTNFKLTANGAGSFAETAVTGQAANLGNILTNQTVSPMTYSVAPDATGTMTFPLRAGLNANTQLISGVENIFVANGGTYFIGGSMAPGGHGLVVGIKNYGIGSAKNASWNGFYYAAGMRYDTNPARLSAVVGGVHANGDGNSIWARRTRQTDGVLDASPLITYNLSGDGSGVYTSTPGHVNVDVDTKTFAASGVDTVNSASYEIYFGSLLAPQSGTGVFLNPQGVLNAASFAPPGYPISPGGVMTLFGSGFPATAATASAPPFGPTLGGVQVSVNGLPAPVYSVTPTQISAIVPFAATGSTATIVVTVSGTKSNPVVVPLAATSPGIFSIPANGIGSAAALHANYSVISAANPAARGEIISMYLTGLGATNPKVQDGAAAPGVAPLAAITGGLAIYVGGVQVPANQIYYSGLAPTLAGLYQVNFMVPNIASGLAALAVQTSEGFTDMVYLPVQ
jgi:uncharacterized protein (TIGR03437 family)